MTWPMRSGHGSSPSDTNWILQRGNFLLLLCSCKEVTKKARRNRNPRVYCIKAPLRVSSYRQQVLQQATVCDGTSAPQSSIDFGVPRSARSSTSRVSLYWFLAFLPPPLKSSAVCGRWPQHVRSRFRLSPLILQDCSVRRGRNRRPARLAAFSSALRFQKDFFAIFFLGKKVEESIGHVLPNLLSGSSIDTRIVIRRLWGHTYGICVATK